jgi:monoamine oxidase
MVEKMKLPSYEVHGTYWCAFDNELKACDFWEQVESVLRRMNSRGHDAAFLEFLNRQMVDSKTRERILAYIEGFEAAYPERISLHALAREYAASEQIGGDLAFRFTAGYDTLINGLACQLNATVEMNSPVRSVNWQRGSVEFECDGRRFSALRAIITLPLAVLQAGSVIFAPAIAGKSRALSLLSMGAVIRIVIRFRERFWENIRVKGESLADLSFLISGDKLFPTRWSTMPVRSAVLVGWSAGPHAKSLAFRDAEFVLGKAIASLAHKIHMDTGALRELVSTYYVHDWQADPYSRGAYSYALVGGSKAFNELARPIGNTLFFAGEATNGEGHNGTVHGAIATGSRAAREVIESLGHDGKQSVA